MSEMLSCNSLSVMVSRADRPLSSYLLTLTPSKIEPLAILSRAQRG